jgi:hypothetical protein
MRVQIAGIFIFSFILILFVATSGCESTQKSDAEICGQAPSGYHLCGRCHLDAWATGNSYGGRCRYCPDGSTCSGDVCGDMQCISGGSVSTTSNYQRTSVTPKPLWALAHDCHKNYKSYSYNGYSADMCNYYANLIRNSDCWNYDIHCY